VEKYGTAEKATDGYIIRRMRFARWIPKAMNTHSEHKILIAFHGRNDVENALQSYVYTYIVYHVEKLKSVNETLKFSHLYYCWVFLDVRELWLNDVSVI
jgi:hypothetical protein